MFKKKHTDEDLWIARKEGYINGLRDISGWVHPDRPKNTRELMILESTGRAVQYYDIDSVTESRRGDLTLLHTGPQRAAKQIRIGRNNWTMYWWRKPLGCFKDHHVIRKNPIFSNVERIPDLVTDATDDPATQVQMRADIAIADAINLSSKEASAAQDYTIDIFVTGYPGFFRYKVITREQAMTHFAAITANGYRRMDDRGNLVWYSPSQLGSIKIRGPGLETQYPDELIRT